MGYLIYVQCTAILVHIYRFYIYDNLYCCGVGVFSGGNTSAFMPDLHISYALLKSGDIPDNFANQNKIDTYHSTQ